MKRYLLILLLLGTGVLIVSHEWHASEFIIADEQSGHIKRIPLSEVHTTGSVFSINGLTGSITTSTCASNQLILSTSANNYYPTCTTTAP